MSLYEIAFAGQAGDQLGQFAVLWRVGAMEVVEIDKEVGEIGAVLGLDVGDQLFRGDAFFLGAQHDRRAVGIVGADIDRLVATQFLVAHPHVGLHVLEHVAEVDRTVGIGQGAGNEDLAGFGHGDSAVGMAKESLQLYSSATVFSPA